MYQWKAEYVWHKIAIFISSFIKNDEHLPWNSRWSSKKYTYVGMYVHCAQWNIWYLIVHATDMKVEKEAFFSKEIKQRQVRDKLG